VATIAWNQWQSCRGIGGNLHVESVATFVWNMHLEYAKYIILFTTFPENEFSSSNVLEWYRIRWQVELVFKRFKSLAQLGHLPKYGDESAKAWLYGKLFVALIVEKLIAHACFISPWGCFLEERKTAKRLARV